MTEMLETVVDGYEAAMHHLCTLQREVARLAPAEPARSVLETTAGLTRDVVAVQVSAARWLLES